ncbi:YhdP family protein [Solilutibacter silvestris]|uniref:YhdP family protein n=1 Tax=Solilutibacter silvestris TaxID=1645665 RepID=UPI003D335003
MRRHIHLAGKSLYYAIGVCLLLLALLTAALSRVMPWIEEHPNEVRAWLSERAGRPVQFSSVHAHWTRRGPLLSLRDLTVGSPDNPLRLGDAELLVSQYTGWLPGNRLTELRLRGIHVNLQRDDDGTWHVRGLPGQTNGGDPLTTLEPLGELQVIGGSLTLDAHSLGLHADIPRIDVRTQVNGARVRVGMRGWLKGVATPTFATMDFDRHSGDGRVYVGSRGLDLKGYQGFLQLFGVALAGGHGSGEAWLDVGARRVTKLVSRSDFSDVLLRSSTPGSTATPVLLQRVQGLAGYRHSGTDWRMDVPTLTITRAGTTQALDGLSVAGGDRLSAAVARVDLPMVASIAALSDRVPAGLARWLAEAQPQGSLRDVRLAGSADQPRVTATADRVGFRAVGHAPGVSGVSGRMVGDRDGGALALDPTSRFTFDWPSGFGVPHTYQPNGNIVWYRDGDGFGFGTDALHLSSPDVSVDARGGLRWQGDGTRPLIGIAADVTSQTPVTASHGYWVNYMMPKATVDWLNMALVGGHIERAHAVVSGDLDDWPFRNNSGLFEVDADVRDAVLKFQPDWPELRGKLTHVQFLGAGMHIETDGTIAGVNVTHAVADIPNFDKAELTIKADGNGDAKQMLEMLRQSPLEKDLGSVFAQLDVGGPARTSLTLFLPFHDDLPYKLDGIAMLDGAKLAHREYGLRFDNVRGSAKYDRSGFVADGLNVVHEGQPGTLDLRAGGDVRDHGNVFEAALEGTFGARELLARVPDLKWMQPHVDGRSRWTVAVDVPKGASATTVNHVELRSDLLGTKLDLPAPFAKVAATTMPSVITLPLPLGQGEIGVKLGRVVNVRARSANGHTGIAMAMGDGSPETPPDSGLVVTGHAPSLDAPAWLAMTGGDDSSFSLKRLDITTDRLLLGAATFPASRLRMTPSGNGYLVQVQGDALQGQLTIPNASNATISGKFDRVHWTSSPGGAAATASASSSSNDIDPAHIPPLALDINDLRIGALAFNTAVLRTHQVAGGLQVDRLDLQSRQQHLAATGSWLGTGRAAQTRVQARLDTQDFGALLDGLGMKGQLGDGKGSVLLDLRWPGAPIDASGATLAGSMNIDMRDGQLVKVQPGVGRVLGLLSLAQLPRRLTLDFHDFFDSGFRFNSVTGDIRFDGGKAHSNNLAIKGSAADIRIEGAADMAAQQFDQTIHVYPKTGNVLTAVGALTGGPVGAAIGAVAGAVLRKPFSQMAEKTYRVTGPWSDPKVQETGKAAAQAPAR